MQAHPHRFPRSHRLSGKLQFAAVYEAKAKFSRFPLVLFSLPNNLPHARLGLSVGRGVGIAVQRNRIKRLLREAFRLRDPQVGAGLDVVIVVRPHEPLTLAEYQQRLIALLQQSAAAWKQKDKRSADGGG